MRRQQDPPDHTRLRSLVNKAFTRQAVNLLEPRIRGLMAALLDDIDDPAGFDLMKAVANPLPVTVIAEMLGVPPEDRTRFTVWSNQRARLIEPTITARERKNADAAGQSLNTSCRSSRLGAPSRKTTSSVPWYMQKTCEC